jgi:hypothetical protein
MRLFLLLLISSFLVIGCRTSAVPNDAAPSQTSIIPVATVAPTETATPSEESTAEIWEIYVNQAYDFSFQYPSVWSLVERPNMVSLVYKGTGIALRIGFKRAGEAVELLQYGGAAGEFLNQGMVSFLGQDVERTALVFQEVTKEIHYNGASEISRGDLVFTLALKSNQNYEQAIIPEEIQAAADELLANIELTGEQE